MDYYKISKKTMKIVGTVLNRPSNFHDGKFFYIPSVALEKWKEIEGVRVFEDLV